MPGLVLVTVAAAFSTGSAINSTLFATARLSHRVARGGELPAVLDHQNSAGVPDRAVLLLGGLAALLAVVGTLSRLVEAASLSFLFTFAAVCALAFHQKAGRRVLTGFGALAASAATVALIVRLARQDPLALGFLAVLVLVAVFGRPMILRRVRVKEQAGGVEAGRLGAGAVPSPDSRVNGSGLHEMCGSGLDWTDRSV